MKRILVLLASLAAVVLSGGALLGVRG